MNMYIDYCRESIVARFFSDVSVLNKCTFWGGKRKRRGGIEIKGKWFKGGGLLNYLKIRITLAGTPLVASRGT